MTTETQNDGPAPKRRPLAESPWFWIWLFAGWALLALFVTAPKYVRRQGRLGLQQGGREYAWRQRVEGASESGAAKVQRPDAPVEEQPAATPNPALTTPSVLPLLLALLALAAVAGVVLAVRNARDSRPSGDVAAPTASSPPQPHDMAT